MKISKNKRTCPSTAVALATERVRKAVRWSGWVGKGWLVAIVNIHVSCWGVLKRSERKVIWGEGKGRRGGCLIRNV